jgi:hypothetical protein
MVLAMPLCAVWYYVRIHVVEDYMSKNKIEKQEVLATEAAKAEKTAEILAVADTVVAVAAAETAREAIMRAAEPAEPARKRSSIPFGSIRNYFSK